MKHVIKGSKSANKASGLKSRTTAPTNRYEPIHLGSIKVKLAQYGWILSSYTEQKYYKTKTAGYGLYQLVFSCKGAKQQLILVSGNNTETLAGVYTGLGGIPLICLYEAKHDRCYTSPIGFESKCLELAEEVKSGQYQINGDLDSEKQARLYDLACFYKQATSKGVYCAYPILVDRFSKVPAFFHWFFNPGSNRSKIDRIIRIRDIAVKSWADLHKSV